MTRNLASALLALAVLPGIAGAQHAVRQPNDGRPAAVVDLRTADGVRLVAGQWRYADARVAQVEGLIDLEPKGAALTAARWEEIDAGSLEARRTKGRLAFSWYRLDVTIPERVGSVATAGTTVVFEIVVDDYAEIWVDGRLPRTLGQTGGSLVGGFNAPNRVVLTRDARPGQTFQLAVFAANAPLSDPPSNFVWVRSATLDFHAPQPRATVDVQVIRRDRGLDAIVPADVRAERLADGFLFTEGPVWTREGYLLFSDPNANTIYRWSDDDGVSVFRTKSGYTGVDIGEYRQPGSNGLALDQDGRLTINEHGNRRVTRLEKNGALTVLADRYDGKRLNSPNDLVYRSDGALYFTDPFFGLPKFGDDPRKELPFTGVFCLSGGQVQLVSRDLSGPNGLAFSPDERFLYVGNWDDHRKVVMRYAVRADGSLGSGMVFFDMTGAPGEDAIDGVKVDQRGNVYVSGPGGLWILSPDGRHLGTLVTPEHAHNFAWGDADRRTLYITARSSLYRIRLNVPGAGGAASPATH